MNNTPTPASVELPQYRCVRLIRALRIKGLAYCLDSDGTSKAALVKYYELTFDDPNAAKMKLSAKWSEENTPRPGSWLIILDGGEKLCLTANEFECMFKPAFRECEKYAETGELPFKRAELSFGDAIAALKVGHKISRAGWNGKGMFLWLKPATTIEAEWCKDPMLKQLAEGNGGSITGLGTVCMYTHDSTGRRAILTGWLASQRDMLSEDWIIIE